MGVLHRACQGMSAVSNTSRTLMKYVQALILSEVLVGKTEESYLPCKRSALWDV